MLSADEYARIKAENERIAAMSAEEYAAWDAEEDRLAEAYIDSPDAVFIPHEQVMSEMRELVASFQLAELRKKAS